MNLKQLREAVKNLNMANISRGELQKNILELRGEAYGAMDELVNSDGEMSHAQAQEFDKLKAVYDLLESKAKQAGIELSTTSIPSASGPGSDVEEWKAVSAEHAGSTIKVLGPRSRLSDHIAADRSGLSMMEYISARVGGNIHSREFKNAMSTTSNADLVPEHLSSEIIDLARAQSRIFQAGARVVPMSSKSLTIARIAGDPTATWKPESDPHNSSDVLTEPVEFVAKTIVSSTRMSIELASDAPNGSRIVTETLAQAIALAIDKAALVGSGDAAEPRGILNQVGVNVLDLGADGAELVSYYPFSKAYQMILEKNGQPNALLFSPREWGSIDRFEDANYNPLRPPASYEMLSIYPTSQIPIDIEHGAATNASYAFMGDFSQLLVGIRTNLELEVTRVGSVSDQSAWDRMQIWFRIFSRVDIQLAQPGWFSVVKGILPSADPYAGS